MNSHNQFVNENFDKLFLFTIVWLLFWIVASVIYRKINNKKIESLPQKKIVYVDKGASGRSLKNWYTRLGGASRCLVITVTDSVIIIRPFFPFNLMFLPEIFDMEHLISISDILNVEVKSSLPGKRVVIEFKKLHTTKIIELTLNDSSSFVNLITR